MFLLCGYGDRPDISEGLTGFYFKFKLLEVAAELHIYAGAGHGFAYALTTPKPPRNGSDFSTNGWRTLVS